MERLPAVTEEQPTITYGGSGKSPSSYDSPLAEPLTTGLEAPPKLICPVCLNLGQEVWNEAYRQKHELGDLVRHIKPARDVYRAARKGCSGCEVIAWVLEPYMKQADVLGKTIRICFGKWCMSASGNFSAHQLEFHCGYLPVEKVLAEVAIKSAPHESEEGASTHPGFRS